MCGKRRLYIARRQYICNAPDTYKFNPVAVKVEREVTSFHAIKAHSRNGGLAPLVLNFEGWDS